MDRTNKDQQLQFLQSLKDSGRLDLLLSELQEVPVNPMGSMHDGAKRRLLSNSSEEFDLVDGHGGDVMSSKFRYQSPIVPKASSTAATFGPSKSVPKELSNLGEWGRTLCELPKYKSKNWCYSEMVQIATSDPQVRSYLGWVTRNGQVSARVQDFANYLSALDWKECEDDPSSL